MTLIFALDCHDGLLLAADSQGTIGTTGQPLKAPVDKLYAPWTNLAWGASGNTALIQRVEAALTQQFSKPDVFSKTRASSIRADLARHVANTVNPIVKGQYLSVAPQEKIDELLASFLFVGQTIDGPVLLEIGNKLTDQSHLDAGYAAIGSGDIFPYLALAGLSHFEIRRRRLNEAKAIAYRVMEDAITVAAWGLGPPVQMIEITKPASGPGTVRRLSADDLQILGDTVLAWKQLESETLTQCLGINP